MARDRTQLPESCRRGNESSHFTKAGILLKKRHYSIELGTAVAQWLRCCATNRRVAGSIPAGVNGIFH